MEPSQLKYWRNRQGLTQKQAAEKLGISLSQYHRYERGTDPITKRIDIIIELLAKASKTTPKNNPEE
jgi:transcriptional regulator with XRE-family HTH domain